MFRYAGMDFVPFERCDLLQLAQALSAEGLSQPEIRRWMCSPGREPIDELKEADRRSRSTSLHLGIYQSDGRPIGRCGLVPYKLAPGFLQTSTYLHSSQWGGWTNRAVKSMLWESALALGHSRILLSVDERNARSLAAARKICRQEGVAVHEDWYPREGRVFVLGRPPDHLDFPAADRERLRDELRRLGSWHMLADPRIDGPATSFDGQVALPAWLRPVEQDAASAGA